MAATKDFRKAKYIGKSYGTGYNRDFVYLEYEYRGVRYEVYENRAKGNEPLAWQHKREQMAIDEALDREPQPETNEPKQSIQEELDEIWHMLGWDE